jgi:hypothetical protein
MWIPINIRKYNDGVQSEIPPEISEGKLKPRDIAFWKREADGSVRLRFGKLEDMLQGSSQHEQVSAQDD